MSVKAVKEQCVKIYFHFAGSQPCLQTNLIQDLENHFLVDPSVICEVKKWEFGMNL